MRANPDSISRFPGNSPLEVQGDYRMSIADSVAESLGKNPTFKASLLCFLYDEAHPDTVDTSENTISFTYEDSSILVIEDNPATGNTSIRVNNDDVESDDESDE